MKRYTVNKKLLAETPEIEIGDKIYKIDDRMKNFMAMNDALQKVEDKGSGTEFDLVVKYGLGEEALSEIKKKDLSFAVIYRIVILIMAAMQGISEEEEEKRFQGA